MPVHSGTSSVLHRHEVVPIHAAEVVDLDDVGVVEHRPDTGLAYEHVDEVGRLAQLREDAFDDEGALEAFRARHDGAKHLGHAPFGDTIEEDVAPEGLRLDVLQSCNHGSRYRQNQAEG